MRNPYSYQELLEHYAENYKEEGAPDYKELLATIHTVLVSAARHGDPKPDETFKVMCAMHLVVVARSKSDEVKEFVEAMTNVSKLVGSIVNTSVEIQVVERGKMH